MTADPFPRLAPFLQDYILARGWRALRPIQVEACRVIFETDAHLLLSAGTASGKTEAAFLPVLTLLHERPSQSVGVLYLSPLKALINDQFARIGEMLGDAQLRVCHWHGDVAQGEKSQLLKHPAGILQITPESLEGLLIRRSGDLPRLFGDLRFVIVDEVHAFMDADRGRQVLCQLARIERATGTRPRRIGLSATLGDLAQAATWLAAGTNRPVETPIVVEPQRKIRLWLEHFTVADFPPQPGNAGSAEHETDHGFGDAAAHYVFNVTQGKRCLIFVNRRADAEGIIAAVRRIAAQIGAPDVYHVHHGSISGALRGTAEIALKQDDRPAITAATATLELGIDIGQLERVIQIDAPFSVASFLQRLGRSGRRDQPPELGFVVREPVARRRTILEEIPWNLLQCIAITQLYLEDRWIEPKRSVSLPLSLLYHQTMSIMMASGALSPAELARRVLTLPPFGAVSQDDFRALLRHLLAIDHLEKTEDGKLIVGLAGERIVRSFRFYAVFPDEEEYVVRDGSQELGSIAVPPPVGERFALAGRTWEVTSVDATAKIIEAKRIDGSAPTYWNGGTGIVHSRILERMRRVLTEDVDYSYLGKDARQRLVQARQLARRTGMDRFNVLPIGGDVFGVIGWLGTIPFRTFERLFAATCAAPLGARRLDAQAPYYATFHAPGRSREEVLAIVTAAVRAGTTPDSLVDATEAPIMGKYDEFVPQALRRKAFVRDELNLDELQALATRWS